LKAFFLWKLLAFHSQFYHKKYCDENKKSNQNFIISFIKFLMHLNVSAIRKNHDDDENNEEKCGENKLSCGKHSDNIFGKSKQLYTKVIILHYQLIHKYYAKTTASRTRISYCFCDWT